jgi:hypothetical protein
MVYTRIKIYISSLLILWLIVSNSNCITPSKPDKNVYEVEGWVDLSKLVDYLTTNAKFDFQSVKYAETVSSVKEHERTLLFIIGVENAFTPDELVIIPKFIEQGGKMILADDTNLSTQLTLHNFKVEFTNHRVLDDNHLYYDNESYSIFTFAEAIIDGSSYQIIFNEPKGLLFANGKPTIDDVGIEIIAASSSYKPPTDYQPSTFSVLDMNDNGISGELEDILGPIPLIVRVYYGMGEVILVSDSGLFIDDLWDRYDNAEFIAALIATLLPAGGKILYFYGKHVNRYSGHLLYPEEIS